jgi:hypothetical protein
MGKLLFMLGVLLGLILFIPAVIIIMIGIIPIAIVMLILLAISLAIAVIVFWFWSLIDCIRNNDISSDERLIWVIVIIFLSIIGSIMYYLLGRKKKTEHRTHKTTHKLAHKKHK